MGVFTEFQFPIHRVRFSRILGTTDAHKRLCVDSQVLSLISHVLVESHDVDLLKASTKCLAHFTHGCQADAAAQVIRGEEAGGHQGLDRIVELMNHERRSIWEASMACVINLTHVECLRPVLGKSAIAALIEKVQTYNVVYPYSNAHFSFT